ncbi:hypothetical protein B0H13DRAFT_589241 [Mycena leptocephala]|nr:hypothetical protein B0H13DRAFT_589241 [Mycena leptocephala]
MRKVPAFCFLSAFSTRSVAPSFYPIPDFHAVFHLCPRMRVVGRLDAAVGGTARTGRTCPTYPPLHSSSRLRSVAPFFFSVLSPRILAFCIFLTPHTEPLPGFIR